MAVIGFLLMPIGRYLLRAGWEEARILSRRRPIAELVVDSTVDLATRERLRLVLDARRFAVDSIGLDAKESFTTYSQLERDTLVLVVSAAYRDRLQSFTWWFPIVGSVPYRGYFDFQEARAVGRDFLARGLDANVRPASAFSTLGWFNDPLVSSTLRLDTLDLANTVIHELLHNTFYAAGQTPFNESFANFVGARGAESFFRSRGQARAVELVSEGWADDKLLGAFWGTVYHALDSAYSRYPDDSLARLTARDSVFARARRSLLDDLAPRMRTVPRSALQRITLDNAALMARRIYLTDLWLFDEVHRRSGGELRNTIRVVSRVVKGSTDPYAALRRWAGGR